MQHKLWGCYCISLCTKEKVGFEERIAHSYADICCEPQWFFYCKDIREWSITSPDLQNQYLFKSGGTVWRIFGPWGPLNNIVPSRDYSYRKIWVPFTRRDLAIGNSEDPIPTMFSDNPILTFSSCDENDMHSKTCSQYTKDQNRCGLQKRASYFPPLNKIELGMRWEQ